MFSRIANAIETFIDYVLIVAMAVAVTAIAWQVVGRYVLSNAPSWSEEFARFVFTWISMIGAAAVLRRRGPNANTVFRALIPRPMGRAVEVAIDLVILISCLGMVYVGTLFAIFGSGRASTAMEVSMFWPELSIPVGMALISVLLILEYLITLFEVRNK